MIIYVERIPSDKKSKMTLQEFADNYMLRIVARELPPSVLSDTCRYCASFDCVEVKEGALLISSLGNGDTYHAAIADYCRVIQGRTLVLYPGSVNKRKEIKVPAVLTYKRSMKDEVYK